MNENILVDITRQTLYIIIKTSAPLLIVSLIVGLVISIIQTITSIQEQTLTFVPKLIAIFIVIMLIGNWIMHSISEFMIELFGNFSYYIK